MPEAPCPPLACSLRCLIFASRADTRFSFISARQRCYYKDASHATPKIITGCQRYADVLFDAAQDDGALLLMLRRGCALRDEDDVDKRLRYAMLMPFSHASAIRRYAAYARRA